MCIKIKPTAPWSPWRNEEQQPLHRLQCVDEVDGLSKSNSKRVCPGQSRIEDPLRDDLKTCCSEKNHCVIYNI
jgi:hypothetical protein